MTVQTQQVLEKAIHLPPVDRAELVERILSSFDRPNREEIDALWAKEAEDRIDAYDQGKIKAIPASRVFEKINRQKS
ncbi:MAG: addiction module protein [Lentisphaerae bacterium]|nr:addiction module protein [Lentisphaerota bacterium]